MHLIAWIEVQRLWKPARKLPERLVFFGLKVLRVDRGQLLDIALEILIEFINRPIDAVVKGLWLRVQQFATKPNALNRDLQIAAR